jgi:hypothetical protein
MMVSFWRRSFMLAQADTMPSSKEMAGFIRKTFPIGPRQYFHLSAVPLWPEIGFPGIIHSNGT